LKTFKTLKNSKSKMILKHKKRINNGKYNKAQNRNPNQLLIQNIILNLNIIQSNRNKKNKLISKNNPNSKSLNTSMILTLHQ